MLSAVNPAAHLSRALRLARAPDVLETALRYYNSKALVNSVNGKEPVMAAVFPS